MTSYITQTVAREQIASMIAEAQQRRVRRDLRQARRVARIQRRLARTSTRGPSNVALYAPNRFGLAGVR
jgi:hypothetical protein